MAYPVDDKGNIRVDFVWGNMAMQPDEQRGDSYDDNEYTVEGGWATKSLVGNQNLATGWTELVRRNGDQSDDGNVRYDIVEYGAHDIIDTGYSNYPAYEPNYAGDGDTGLETFVTMPDLAGLTTSAANALIGPLGFPSNVMVVNTTRIGATTVNDGKIQSQEPLAGVRTNNYVNVNVQTYNAPEVPNVVGLTEAAATTALNNAGLVKGTVTTADNAGGATALNNNLIKSATPAVGTTVNTGSSVALVKYAYVVASTTGPIAGFNRVSAGTSFSLNGNQSVMYVVGQTVKPTVGDTISVTGSDDASHNVSWTVAAVENNDSYNTGGTAVKVTLVTGAITSDTATGGTWTKI